MPILVIDGNIGSGKSTIIDKLKKDNFSFVIDTKSEKIDNFDPWLKLYYKNMDKYALGFQMEVLMSHMKNKYLIDKKTLTITERSPLSCLHIFGKHLVDNNILSKIEQNLCLKINNEYGWIPKNIIYLKTDTDTAYSRVVKRDRKGENNISKQYLDSLNNNYNKLSNRSIEFNVHIIDANRNLELVYKDVKKIIIDYQNIIQQLYHL